MSEDDNDKRLHEAITQVLLWAQEGDSMVKVPGPEFRELRAAFLSWSNKARP